MFYFITNCTRIKTDEINETKLICNLYIYCYIEDMESNEQNRLSNGDIPVHRDVDWARYGLRDPEMQRNEKRNNGDSNNAFDPEMYQAGANELFAQEYVRKTVLVNCALLTNVVIIIITTVFCIKSLLEFRSLVEIKFLHLSACIVWYLGWGFHLLSY